MITTVVLPIVVICVLVVVNGLFVAAEFALVGARRSRLQTLADQGSRPARWLLTVFDDPTGKDGYIAVAQLGITLASVGLGMYGEPAVAKWLYGPFETWGLSEAAAHTVGFVVALGGITYLHVVFGEMIPKALALQAPEQVSLRVNPAMRLFAVVFKPFVHVLNAAALGMMRLLRIPEPDERLALHTSAELEIVTDESADSGQLGELQRTLIANIFDLGDRRADELMTPRGQVEAIDVHTSREALDQRIAASPRSRYPVVDGDLDHVLGLLHVKDVIRAAAQDQTPPLREMIRPLPTVAATTTAERLLARLRSRQTQAAMVVDEFGSTIGLVTFDDLIAEVMDDQVADGAIGDVVHHADDSLHVGGRVTLADLRDDHGVDLTHPEVTTIAGLVLAAHGSVPPVGTVVEHHGHAIEIESVEGRTIRRVVIRPVVAG